ncbi:uncharacterized protein B4U80_10403, partial [Leptotrombidium deliense]
MNLNTFTIEKCFIMSNERGFSSSHYNRDIGDNNDCYHRHNNETIILSDNKIDSHLYESVFVNTPFYDPLNFSLSEINYTLINNKFENNNQGIVQYSRDGRNSNNLFHWVVNNSVITLNVNGGIVLNIPYVWNYNENYTHTVSINNNTIVHNKNFEFVVDGHFARFNFTDNLIRDNNCKNGLFTVQGMEKEMLVKGNTIFENNCDYIVELNMQSHADKFGVVKANFKKNIVMANRAISDRHTSDRYRPLSYTIALRGVQNVNITKNLLNNPHMQFEFIAGVFTASIDNKINVAKNWWGTFNVTKIEERIFDFNDWNSYAFANYTPILAQESLDSVLIPIEPKESAINFNKPFGGRLDYDVTFERRSTPYIIKSDLTILPPATLTIKAGVELEFYASVGILVLGDLVAAGTVDSPIIMRPVNSKDNRQRIKRKDIYSKTLKANDIGNVRLCYTETCEEALRSKQKDGFLEIFNQTTLEWVPVCDDRFTEFNAEVVCQQLGFSRLNVHLKRGNRLDMGPTSISRVKFWPESLQCSGHETRLDECDIRLNGYGNYSHGCQFDGNSFIYIYCGSEKKFDEDEYWGGIRFANPGFEHKIEGFHIPTKSYYIPQSKLESVHIQNAGILHGEKNAAIQMIQRSVYLEHVNVTGSAHHGIEVIATYNHVVFEGLRLTDNLGAGINYLLLNGALTRAPSVQYVPLKASTLPYNAFSLVDICDTNKNFVIEGRVI